MIELITNKTEPVQPKTLKMCEMKPLQVCVVVEDGFAGAVVMRATYVDRFEVIVLSRVGRDGCWVDNPTLLVRELYPGETYPLKLS